VWLKDEILEEVYKLVNEWYVSGNMTHQYVSGNLLY
jgi:hypothetical protein